ncbi:hypothetical protein PCNPT3_06325 [Psychromonas sp. CNPT3]|uniref:DUF2913 family protein n=1 Tax=Psychromonas sp. CNPT3 TaxID=314282 RepID=UPI00006E34DF|nr:DUF2913 family protein [Psychromonas sp. CNPT3]AGH81205.1 hypothetical protein PCNPT3_06325 [Psychromonas sp. CNPT3]
MALFSEEMYKLLDLALSELNASHESGRTPQNDLNEAHYLGAWVTTAMKKKRFDSIVLSSLKNWQSKARSLGRNAGLKDQFIYLERCYSQILDSDKKIQAVTRDQFEAFYKTLSAAQWMVTTDTVVVDKMKCHSSGDSSLVACKAQMDTHFNEKGDLIKPISFYIRGDVQEAVKLAFAANVLLHKKTDHKSRVKYHGEYVVYVHNDGEFLPEFPL